MKVWLKMIAGALGGLITGAILVTVILYFWPFPFEHRTPIALQRIGSQGGVTESFFLNITGDNILGTHGGGFPFKPFPDGIALLGRGMIPNTFALATKFRDRPDGNVIGFGTELEIAHPGSSFIRGKIMTHTLWTVVIPGRGALFLYQTENNWRLFKQVLLPMLITGKDFHGKFYGVNTLGPLDGYRGLIIGGTGEFSGVTGSFLEIGMLRHMTPDGAMGGVMELRVNYRHPTGGGKP